MKHDNYTKVNLNKIIRDKFSLSEHQKWDTRWLSARMKLEIDIKMRIVAVCPMRLRKREGINKKILCLETHGLGGKNFHIDVCF